MALYKGGEGGREVGGDGVGDEGGDGVGKRKFCCRPDLRLLADALLLARLKRGPLGVVIVVERGVAVRTRFCW